MKTMKAEFFLGLLIQQQNSYIVDLVDLLDYCSICMSNLFVLGDVEVESSKFFFFDVSKAGSRFALVRCFLCDALLKR